MLKRAIFIKTPTIIARSRQSLLRALTPTIVSVAAVFSLYSTQLSAEVINYLVIQKQNEPMQIIRDDVDHSGIISDLVHEIFKNSEHTVNIKAMPFKAMLPLIESGAVSNWITYGSKSWSPPQNINLTKTTILTTKVNLLVAKKSGFNYNGIESLFDKTLVLIVGFDHPGLDSYLNNQQIHNVRLVDYKRVFMELLLSNRFAGFVGTDVRLRYQLKNAQQLGMRVSANDFNQFDFSDVIAPYPVHLSLDPGMPPSLQTFIDNRIQQLHKDGTIETILNRYR